MNELYSRRATLQRFGTGLGLITLPDLLDAAPNPLAIKQSHFKPKAKHIIHVYLNGGPSQVDTWDYKPRLKEFGGKPLPVSHPTEREVGVALPSPFKFRQYGESGIWCSEVFQKTAAKHADKICVIKSMYANTPNHEQSMRLMNTGDERLSRPSYGAWLTYGLGTENQNLPGYVAMCPGLPVADSSNWRSSFLPGIYQGTYLDTRNETVETLIANIKNSRLSPETQRQQLNLLVKLNRDHQLARTDDPNLEARIQSFELAYRMQMEATDAFDISRETQATQDLYRASTVHGRQLLIARRLIERGVRVVQCFHGDVQPWDTHGDLANGLRNLGSQADAPVAALLTDLEQRGLLNDTLVICGGEFGRTPATEIPIGGGIGTGRDHNHHGFTVWLAGGGVKGGYSYGNTDEFGYRAIEKRTHVHDLHATMLKLMGIDHTKLTYRHSGRDFRLTDVHGHVIDEIIA
ncbi:MAG: sulfatase [Planctomycetaceae bacterium]|nr:sulfatase [Planctomycetaceae bacterium]